MHKDKSTPICSIVIPAYNEEDVIAGTLKSLLSNASHGEFDVLVVCNGCKDNTADIARETAPSIRVLETPVASKSNALNLGVLAANTTPVVFLDADIKTTASAVRSLVHRLNWAGAFMAYGTAEFQTQNCSWAVRAFYRTWQLNPYFDQKKMGGFFAVSKAGMDKLGAFPDTLNDDEYVRRRLIANSTWAEKAPYSVEPPRDLKNLIKVRSRVYRGNGYLEQDIAPLGRSTRLHNAYLFAKRILLAPTAWLGAFIFGVTAIAAHFRNAFQPSSKECWESDRSTRVMAAE